MRKMMYQQSLIQNKILEKVHNIECSLYELERKLHQGVK